MNYFLLLGIFLIFASATSEDCNIADLKGCYSQYFTSYGLQFPTFEEFSDRFKQLTSKNVSDIDPICQYQQKLYECVSSTDVCITQDNLKQFLNDSDSFVSDFFEQQYTCGEGRQGN